MVLWDHEWAEYRGSRGVLYFKYNARAGTVLVQHVRLDVCEVPVEMGWETKIQTALARYFGVISKVVEGQDEEEKFLSRFQAKIKQKWGRDND